MAGIAPTAPPILKETDAYAPTGPGRDEQGIHHMPPSPTPPKPAAQVVVDAVDSTAASVETRDHRITGDPSTWGREEWMAAIKSDPEKYGNLYLEMANAGRLKEGVEGSTMDLFVSNQIQTFNRHFTMLSQLLTAIHQTRKEAAIRV